MLRYYFRLGLLSIRANPALSALMIAAIAIGIGACMTIVTVRHVMADNPIEHKNDRLFHVQVDNWNPNNPYQEPNEPPEQVTYLDATALLEAGRAHRQVISFKSDRVVQPDDEEILPFQETIRATSADFFAMFDVPFKYGSGWDAEADRAEAQAIAAVNASGLPCVSVRRTPKGKASTTPDNRNHPNPTSTTAAVAEIAMIIVRRRLFASDAVGLLE